MGEFHVPPVAENPFRAHYRGLILGTALRVAESELERLRSNGQRRRAQRVEHDTITLRELTGAPAPYYLPVPEHQRWFGRPLRGVVSVAWVAAAGFLLAYIVRYGLHSWTTAAADLTVIVLTALWFAVSIDDLLTPSDPGPQQLELFD